MMYGSETWAMKVEDMQRLERAEKMMIRWMCGVTLKDRKGSEELRQRLGIMRLTGFEGAATAQDINVIANYVQGIDPECKQ